MMKKIIFLLLLQLCLFPVAQATERFDADQIRSLLKQVVEKNILPVYQELDTSAGALTKQSSEFCANPNAERLQAVRKHWSETLSSWQQSSAFLFGPTIENQIDFSIYFLPVKKSVVNKLLSSTDTITPETLDKSGIGGQGLAVLEYLLFDREKDDEQTLALFTDDAGKQRCDYLTAVSALLAGNIQTITSHWQTGTINSYATAIMTAGKGSPQFTKAHQPLELLINRLYQAIQAVEIKKLGIAMGLRGSRSGPRRAYPYKLEAWRSGHSLQNIRSSLLGLKRIFEDGGLLEWLESNQQTELANKISTQLNALYKTEFASNDLFQIISDEPNTLRPFYDDLRAFATTIRNGLAPALGVQLGFNQNDGD